MNRPTPYLALALLALATPILLAPAFPKPRSQGGTGSPNTWGEEMRTFFSPYYDLDTGSVVKTQVPSYTQGTFPAAGTAGRLARTTDGSRCLWLDTGTQWVSICGEQFDLKEFGARADGTTDDTTAVQAALTAAQTNGGVIYHPGGTIKINLARLTYTSLQPLAIVCPSWDSGFLWNPPTSYTSPALGMFNIYGTGDANANHIGQVAIIGCSFDFGGSRAAGDAEGYRGLHIYNADNIYIVRNKFKGGRGEMVGLGNIGSPTTPGDRAWVINNFFYDFAQDGVNPNVFDTVIDGNTMVQGDTPIEAGRNGAHITNNVIKDMEGAIKISSVDGFVVANNRMSQCSTTNTGSLQGCIHITGGGSTDPSKNGTITSNVMTNTTNHAFDACISSTRGTSTTDNENVTIINNTCKGLRRGIRPESLTKSSITGNQISSVNIGIEITDSAQVTNLDIKQNAIFDATTLQIENLASSARNIRIDMQAFGSYVTALLPAAGTAGRLARVTDGARGIWMDNGTEWIKINPNIDPKDFGVRGDGTTDDTANLLLAWGAAQTTGRELHLGPGTFRVCDDGVTAQTYGIFYTSSYVVKMRGAGKESTFLSNCGTLGAMVRLNGGYSELSDLTIDQNGSTGKALQVFSQHSKVRDVLIRDQGGASVFAWTVDGSTLSDFENVIISTSTNGLDIGPTTATNYNNYRNITIESCDGDYGLRINTGSGIKFYGIHFEDHGTCTDSNPIYIVASNDIELNGLTAEWKTGTTLTANGYIMVDNVNTLSLRDCYLDHASSASESLLYVSHASTRNISVDSCYVRSTRTGMTFATTANGFIGLHLDKITTIWTSAATGVNNTGAITDETIAGWTDSSGASSHTIDAVNFFGTNIAGNIAITSRADQSCFGCTGTISGTGAAALSRIGSTASISTLSVPGSLNIGAGASILNVLSASATLDFDLSAATTHDLTVTVTGSASGDVCSVGVPNGSITADTLFWCWVSASNTATVRAMRTAGTPNPASGTFRVMVTRF